MDLDHIRTRLAGLEGRAYWRSLDELADTPEFHEYVDREFPSQASEFNDPAGRRQFLKLMGASLALAGVGACTRQPEEKIVPYVRQPEEIIPGRPLFYATAMPQGGFAEPLLAENHMGRPTKLEGNPEHPASLGGTDLFSQASVLTLYDPDRSRTVIGGAEDRSWVSFQVALQAAITSRQAIGGQGLRILTEPITSPSLLDQLRSLLAKMPEAKWHQWDAVYGARQGGAPDSHPVYQLAKADVVVSLDSDFLGFGPGMVRYTKDFSSRRRIGTPTDAMNRLYVVEPVPTVTGAKADHRLPLKARDIHGFAAGLAAAVGAGAAPGTSASDEARRWIAAVAADLQAHKGRSAVIAGDRQPAAVHALARAMNEALGNVGATVTYGPRLDGAPADGAASIAELAADMNAGRVDVLVILGGNPVFTAPADLNFGEGLKKVGLRVHLGLYFDETAELCQWHIPEAHFLESWADARSFDGTVSLRAAADRAALRRTPGDRDRRRHERRAGLGHGLAEGLLDQGVRGPDHARVDAAESRRSAVRERGRVLAQRAARRISHGGVSIATAPAAAAPATDQACGTSGDDVRRGRRQHLRRGANRCRAIVPCPLALPPCPRRPHRRQPGLKLFSSPTRTSSMAGTSTTAGCRRCRSRCRRSRGTTSPTSIPRPRTRCGLENGDLIDVRYGGKSARVPAWIMPGMARDVVAVHFGYGRRKTGRVGTGVGVDTFGLRTSKAPWFDGGAEVVRTGERYDLASTQNHFMMEGRHPVRVVDVEDYRAHPKESIAEQGHPVPGPDMSLYKPFEYKGNKWGMAIDLNSCTGCQVCIAACVSENNIPVVGKSQVLRSREMHWIRVDTYFEGDPAAPEGIYHQPVPCQQCENAPCEVGLPGRGDRAQRRRPERHGLQPLRRHALLLEQLPVQGAPLQLHAVCGFLDARAARAA